ncbi:hypothetical protein B0T25DRAFT_297645 [Lasiosphaeria hispida]|uniref:Uncharacterized protein n=1 Tax=Lasiosphaeria hispida TaxID=260671 RepID=A0AAJ0MBE4_9PEZI|nr:hypothetical protein B0T25DRAFT_297645 [Lasiosphaeria hispida]
MSDNSGSSDSQFSLPSLAVAVAALVISVVALAGTATQVLQQYLSTAVGCSSCGARVIGAWARYIKLVFHLWELRFEVVFSSPVIVVTPRDTTHLSESERLEFVLDGTPKSIQESGIQPSSVLRRARFPKNSHSGGPKNKFDRRKDRYVADGNGVLITGINVPYVGLVFTVALYGDLRPGRDRVIPSEPCQLSSSPAHACHQVRRLRGQAF